MSFQPKVAESNKKGMHPAWRAVGFILIVVVFGGSFFAARYLLTWLSNGANFQRVASMNAALPALLGTMLGIDPLWVSLGLALIISIFFFAFITIAWAFVRDDSESKKNVKLSDVAKMYGKKRKNVRKCR